MATKLNEQELRAAIRAEIKNALKEADGTTPKPLQLKGGLSKQQLGGSAAMKFAQDFIDALQDLDDVKKAKAIGFVLASIGMDPVTLQKRLGAIKTSLKQYTK
jgi:hypothetical protein